MVDSVPACDIPANKLVDSLNRALLDPQVRAVDLIPTSPGDIQDAYYPFVIGDGCLGIPFATVCPILKYAWNQIVTGVDDARHLDTLTRCIVALNPDHHSAWNRRKELLQSGTVAFADELQFLDKLVTYKRHCKASLLWHHRRWIIERCSAKSDAPALWEAETRITGECCARYPRNYYCWVYRWWMYQRMLNTSRISDLEQMEIRCMVQWTSEHPADYAAYYYLQLLVDSYAGSGADLDKPRSIAQAELETTANLLQSVYCNYESVWHHRRWCLGAVAPITRTTLQDEMRFADDIVCRFNGDEQVGDLARRHVDWVRDMCHINT